MGVFHSLFSNHTTVDYSVFFLTSIQATEMLLSGCRMDSGMAEKYNLISRAPFHSNSIKNTILNTIHRLALNQAPVGISYCLSLSFSLSLSLHPSLTHSSYLPLSLITINSFTVYGTPKSDNKDVYKFGTTSRAFQGR